MAFDFEFLCDSLGSSLSSDTNSFFWCSVCKGLEDSISTDLNLLKFSSEGFIAGHTSINQELSNAVVTPTTELNTYIEDFQTRANDVVPELGDPVQIQGGAQSTFNSYHESFRGLGENLSADTLSRIGIGVLDNYAGQSFPQTFLGKTVGPLDRCFDDLMSSYGCAEFNVNLQLFDLLGTYGDLANFVRSLMDAINGYVAMGCSPENGLSMEASANSSLSQLPLDENYEFDMAQVIDEFDISQTFKDNLTLVDEEISPTVAAAKSRISI